MNPSCIVRLCSVFCHLFALVFGRRKKDDATTRLGPVSVATQVHGGIDNVPVSLLLEMNNISQACDMCNRDWNEMF